jgi:hypothetical protein
MRFPHCKLLSIDLTGLGMNRTGLYSPFPRCPCTGSPLSRRDEALKLRAGGWAKRRQNAEFAMSTVIDACSEIPPKARRRWWRKHNSLAAKHLPFGKRCFRTPGGGEIRARLRRLVVLGATGVAIIEASFKGATESRTSPDEMCGLVPPAISTRNRPTVAPFRELSRRCRRPV